ncbi:10966_t:CDS:2, partial [Acaulospora colombiana]
IARAGKGTAVFVAENENPDAKLMALLRAARGAVVEDLTVDWGSGAKDDEPLDIEDDFELVSLPGDTPVDVKLSHPISLYDERSNQNSPELGPQKMTVHLPPSPMIQQAPKSDKLPIPLYPGFRCNIFAIARKGENPGPHSPYIEVKGNVLGKTVSLQIPVEPIHDHPATTANTK